MDFDEQWAATTITVTSPNEQVHLSVRDDREVAVRFDPGYLQRAWRPQVAEQLGRVCRLAFVERQRRYFELRSRIAGRPVRPAVAPVTEANRRYAEEAAALVASGASYDGRVAVTVTGMRSFVVTLAPGSLELGDEALASAFGQAAEAVLSAQAEGVRRIRAEVYYREAG